MRRLLRGIGLMLVGLIVILLTAWCAGALYYSHPGGPRMGTILTIAFPLAVVLAFLFLPRRGRTLVGVLVACALVITWWVFIPATNERDWQTDVSVAPWVTQDGDLVTVHGVRNFEYRTETDFTPRWEDRTYDLRQLDSGDLIAVYWAGKAIAHVMVSFGFAGRDYLAVSIETRKARGQSYSTLAGIYKQYELVYIAGDERDLIGLRTSFRTPQEDVYVYRVQTSRENLRRLFLDYMKGMNDIREHPQFYNTLTTNCTTTVLLHTRVNQAPPWSWKILLSGYVPDYAYELGRLDQRVPFAELERQARVNDRAHGHERSPDFSQRIRAQAR